MNRIIRRAAVLAFIVLQIFLIAAAPSALADDSTLLCPVFLNGEELYATTGEAGLLSVAADAAREAVRADAAILPAACAGGSLPAGPADDKALNEVFDPKEELIACTVRTSELAALINDAAVYGANTFPHLSGITAEAQRILNPDGKYAGQVTKISRGTETIASLPAEPADGTEEPHAGAADAERYTTIDLELTLVTTRFMTEAFPWLKARADETGVFLQDAFVSYIRRTADEAIAYYAASPRFFVLSDVIDTELVIQKLQLRIPSPVVVNLSRPATAQDTIFYALSGQGRSFICRMFGGEIPYSLSISGASVTNPASVSTEISVTQTLPPARKTANTLDESTVFVDLRYNDTVPAGSTVSVDVTGIYDAETVLYIYFYDENGDIVFTDISTVVDSDGFVSFPVDPGTTYLINSRELDSTVFVPPTPARPYTGGMLLIFCLFILWMTLFLTKRRKERKRAETQARGQNSAGRRDPE